LKGKLPGKRRRLNPNNPKAAVSIVRLCRAQECRRANRETGRSRTTCCWESGVSGKQALSEANHNKHHNNKQQQRETGTTQRFATKSKQRRGGANEARKEGKRENKQPKQQSRSMQNASQLTSQLQ